MDGARAEVGLKCQRELGQPALGAPVVQTGELDYGWRWHAGMAQVEQVRDRSRSCPVWRLPLEGAAEVGGPAVLARPMHLGEFVLDAPGARLTDVDVGVLGQDQDAQLGAVPTRAHRKGYLKPRLRLGVLSMGRRYVSGQSRVGGVTRASSASWRLA